MPNPIVYFDVEAAGKNLGRIEFELFSKNVPMTALNFYSFCKDFQGNSYNQVPFHRIIPEFMIQGGDIKEGNGFGSISIYGGKFPDENFALKHDRPYLLSMANSGPNTNGSQFFITTVPCPWLDNKHVVFGQVVKGTKVVDAIEKFGSRNGTPSARVKIAECGIISEIDPDIIDKYMPK